MPDTCPADLGWDVRLYDYVNSAWVRRRLPQRWVGRITFELLADGGFGTGSFEALVPWETIALTGTERVDVLFGDERVYRGYVKITERTWQDAPNATPQLYGLIELLNRYQVRRRYAYGVAVDVSQVFTDIINDDVKIAGRLPSVVVDAQTIGVNVKAFDAVGVSVAQAFGQLMDMAPDMAIWGHDLDGSDADRLYWRPRPTAVKYVYTVGGSPLGQTKADVYQYPVDYSAVRNTLYIEGGQADPPNLMPNPSFEHPLPNSDLVNNMILNSSFEDHDTDWTLGGGATVWHVGEAPAAHGGPHSGQHWLELDTNGETAYQDVDVVSGEHYTASVWIRREDALIATDCKFTVQCYDVSDTLIVTYETAPFVPPNTGNYRLYTLDVDLASYLTVTYCRVRMTALGGTADNDGVLFDDVAFYLYAGVGQDKWAMILRGDAKLGEINWVCKEVAPYHGGYTLKMQATNIGGTGDALEVYTYRHENYISVAPNEHYTMALFWRSTGDDSLSWSFGVAQRKVDYTAGDSIESSTIFGSLDQWQLEELAIDTAADTLYLQPFIRHRGGEPLYVDALWFSDGALPYEIEASGGYWEGDSYERILDVTDSNLTSLYETASSIDLYGVREERINNPNVVDYTSALALASGWLRAHGEPEVPASLEIPGTPEIIRPDGLVRVVGFPSSVPALLPARIVYELSETARITVDLGTKRPELVDLIGIQNARLR